MRKLIEAVFVSLDGVVESPGNWAFQYFTQEENKQYSLSRLVECDALLLGRATYEEFAKIGAAMKGDPFYDKVSSLPKHVASTTLRDTTWNATLIQGDVSKEVAKLKSQPGKNIMKYGCGNIDKTLIEHGLIDEFHFTTFPVVAGKGRRLFEGVNTANLKLTLTDTKRFVNGAVTLSYVKERL
jgi:dihydrofolate reductase